MKIKRIFDYEGIHDDYETIIIPTFWMFTAITKTYFPFQITIKCLLPTAVLLLQLRMSRCKVKVPVLRQLVMERTTMILNIHGRQSTEIINLAGAVIGICLPG